MAEEDAVAKTRGAELEQNNLESIVTIVLFITPVRTNLRHRKEPKDTVRRFGIPIQCFVHCCWFCQHKSLHICWFWNVGLDFAFSEEFLAMVFECLTKSTITCATQGDLIFCPLHWHFPFWVSALNLWPQMNGEFLLEPSAVVCPASLASPVEGVNRQTKRNKDFGTIHLQYSNHLPLRLPTYPTLLPFQKYRLNNVHFRSFSRTLGLARKDASPLSDFVWRTSRGYGNRFSVSTTIDWTAETRIGTCGEKRNGVTNEMNTIALWWKQSYLTVQVPAYSLFVSF